MTKHINDLIQKSIDVPREKLIIEYVIENKRLEKRIAELEQKLEQIEKDLADYQFNYPSIKELEKENAELQHKVDTLQGFLDHNIEYDMGKAIQNLKKENSELRNNGFTVSAMTEQQLKVAIEKGEQLERENAELKKQQITLRNERNTFLAQNEQYEKEAEEYAIGLFPNDVFRQSAVIQGIIKFTEPREKRIAELEAQIEKMKNWCNCKNYQQCLIELAEQGKGMKPSECCVNCKKWEIKEK